MARRLSRPWSLRAERYPRLTAIARRPRRYNLNRVLKANSVSLRLGGKRSRSVLGSVGATIAIALLVYVVFGGASPSEAGFTVVVALLYATPLIVWSITASGPIEQRVSLLPFPLDWVAFLAIVLVSCALCITLSSGAMLLLGYVSPVNPWPQLKFVNRLAFLMCFGATTLSRIFLVIRRQFENRTKQLEHQVAEQVRERESQQQDVERAREIQQALLPKQLPVIEGCEIAAGWLPARVVGGDYFDAIRLSEHRVALAIADVSGKGMGAALLMSNLQAIVRSFAPAPLSAAEICAKANEVISGNIAPGKFITFFYAIVDTSRMAVDYCSAGHNPPLLMRRNGEIELLNEGGPVLGIFPKANYTGGAVQLHPGDALILVTDGITEAMTPEGEEFGDDRLVALIKENRGIGAEALRKRIMSTVTQFTGGSFHDDATLLVLSVAAAASAAPA